MAVAQIEPGEVEALVERLAGHFVEVYGAPSLDAARPVARDELSFMADLCDEHEPNTLLAVERSLTEAGVKEGFRAIKPVEAELEASPDYTLVNSPGPDVLSIEAAIIDLVVRVPTRAQGVKKLRVIRLHGHNR